MAYTPPLGKRLPTYIPEMIPGFRLPDGTDFQALVNLNHSLQTGIIATAAGTVLNSVQLVAAINVIATAASGSGVRLPTAAAGNRILIKNAGANAVRIFAPSFATINGIAGDTGILQQPGSFVWYICDDPGNGSGNVAWEQITLAGWDGDDIAVTDVEGATQTLAEWMADVVTDTITIAGSLVAFQAGQTFEFSNVNGSVAFPVPGLRPTGADKYVAFDLVPNGSPPVIGQGVTWFDCCTADIVANPSGAFSAAHFAVSSTGDVLISSNPFNGASQGRIVLSLNNGIKAQINAAGALVLAGGSPDVRVGELGFVGTAHGVTPGLANYGKIALVAGTTPGTAKLVAYAGTSATPTTIVDNIGAGF